MGDSRILRLQGWLLGVHPGPGARLPWRRYWSAKAVSHCGWKEAPLPATMWDSGSWRECWNDVLLLHMWVQRDFFKCSRQLRSDSSKEWVWLGCSPLQAWYVPNETLKDFHLNKSFTEGQHFNYIFLPRLCRNENLEEFVFVSKGNIILNNFIAMFKRKGRIYFSTFWRPETNLEMCNNSESLTLAFSSIRTYLIGF